jgi:serine O-acetyltransferase
MTWGGMVTMSVAAGAAGRNGRGRSDRPVRRGGAAAARVHRFGVWRDGLSVGAPRKALRVPYVLLHRRVRNRYRIELHYTTIVGQRVRFSDRGDIVVGNRVVIGDDCDIGHGVTLGKPRDDSQGWPVIGDRVTIAPGAAVIGAIHIGDDVVVGPNAVVLADVPAGARVSARSAVVAPPGSRPPVVTEPATLRTGRGSGSVHGPAVHVGRGCVVGYAVTIGWHPPAAGPPPATTIGDGVVIGDGAVVIAGVSLGTGASVGANAVVDADVPPGVAVVAPTPGILRPLRRDA